MLCDLEKDRVIEIRMSHQSFRPALRDYRFYLLLGVAYALLVSTGGIFLWLPTIVRNSGVKSVGDVGLLSSIPFVVGTVAQIAVARHSDKKLERRWHAAIPALVGALGWAMLPVFSKNSALSITMLTLATMGTLAAMGPFWTMPSTIFSGTASAAGIALITTFGGFGGFISPIFVGWMASRTGSLAAGLYYFAAIMLLGAVAAVLVGGQQRSLDSVVADRMQSATARG